jgi:uncharacterized ParB-like nuclease family protein
MVDGVIGVEVVMIEAERLRPLTENLRRMTDEDMALLERSIRDLGVVEPLHVVEYEGGRYYLIVNGNHRYTVLTGKMGMDKLPCVILGRDWPMERVYAEAVRLNSISGEFDIVAIIEKMGPVVRRWLDSGMRRPEVAMSLGLRLNSRLLKAVVREEKKEKRGPAAKVTDLEKLIDSLAVAPVAFFGRFCVIKDAECVSAIREILLRAEKEGLVGVDVLREVLVRGLEPGGEGGL